MKAADLFQVLLSARVKASAELSASIGTATPAFTLLRVQVGSQNFYNTFTRFEHLEGVLSVGWRRV